MNIFFIKKIFIQYLIPALLFSVLIHTPVNAEDNSNLNIFSESYIKTEKEPGVFIISENGKTVPLLVSSNDYPGVIRIVKLLQTDLEKVTGSIPNLGIDTISKSEGVLIAGTIGKSGIINNLIEGNKIDVEGIKGKWETFIIQTVKNPLPEVERAIVIAGSDKRGTMYGILDISQKIGVSPWYWWADVPVEHHPDLYIKPGKYSYGEPKVRYRGFFINDEAPALSGWADEKFGTDMFNHQLYEHVFELILRLRGNFLWPAMWGRAFYDDDSLNPKLADEYGIVISTSHHEPMMRAHVEWQRYGSGPWNYEKNEEKLKEFWREGIKRMGGNESVVTLAMRGDGDEAMSEEANVELLEKIVKDQREIIADVTGKDPSEVPQVWALYKEVQEYYEKGMRVPDDVTILLCDDNWGNLRKLPRLNREPRKGGLGIYYHYDYVGGPRNYKWLNTNQIERVWEQMHLAYEYGANRIWIVNVGDIKPMEFPISFWFDYAWNPEQLPAEKLPEYYRLWAEEQFGKEYSEAIADILARYTKYNSRRKPELLSPETYSLINYREAERIVEEYNQIEKIARSIYEKIPGKLKDAYYQLVMHPVEACANLNELYVTAAKNRLYAKQGRSITNDLAERTKQLFDKDAEITDYYNNELEGGKWLHMMDQTHIGYTYWQQPDQNNMPEVEKIDLPEISEMGVAVEGADNWWPANDPLPALPVFNPYDKQSYYIEIFNRGVVPFKYSVKTEVPWVILKKTEGTINKQERIWVDVDWENAPEGKLEVPITIIGEDGKNVIVNTKINNPSSPKPGNVEGFVESNGYVSIEAKHFTKAAGKDSIIWQIIPNLGRASSAVTPFPVTAQAQEPGGDSPHLEYKINFLSEGEVKVKAFFSPTLNFLNDPEGINYAVSIDDEKPQICNLTYNPNPPDLNYDPQWNQWVAENINKIESIHKINEPGEHILKIWMVDPGIVLQKIVIDTGGLKPSYLGPPESFKRDVKNMSGK